MAERRDYIAAACRTREEAIAMRRWLIAGVCELDRAEAKGYRVGPDSAPQAGDIGMIRAIERRWNIKPWDRQRAIATTPKAAVQTASEGSYFGTWVDWEAQRDSWPAWDEPRSSEPVRLGEPLGAWPRGWRVVFQDAGGPVAVMTTAARTPLLPGLVQVGASRAEFFEALRQADELRDDAGHDMRGALLTASGQVSTAPPQGQDAFLIYCRNCRKGAWFLPPVSMDAATVARARIAQLGGACDGPGRPPPPPGETR